MKQLVISLLYFLIAISLPVSAGTITSSTGGGMYATEEWGNGNASLEWSVTQVGANWQYQYSWLAPLKDLSNIIFQVSSNFTSGNILDGTTSGWELDTFGSKGNSSPGIPGNIYGLKWGAGSGALQNDGAIDFTILSDRAPMWGDFYAKDGTSGTTGGDVYAYNSSFGSGPLAWNGGTAPYGYVAVPDTVTTVPIPQSATLIGAGLLTMLFITTRRRQRHPKLDLFTA